MTFDKFKMFSKKQKKNKTRITLPFDTFQHITSFMSLNDIVCLFIVSHEFYEYIVKYEIEKIDKIDMKIENIYTEYIGDSILSQPYQLNPYFKIKIKNLDNMWNISTFRIDMTHLHICRRCYHIWYDVLDFLSKLKNLIKMYIYTVNDDYILDKYDVAHIMNIEKLEHLELQHITITCDSVEYGLFELCQSISIINGVFEDNEMFLKHNKKVTTLFLQGNNINDNIVEYIIESFENLKSLTLCNTLISDKCILKIKENENEKLETLTINYIDL
jgi:hypothetical protein